MDAVLADLNPPQMEAVTHTDGPLLVIAGAGSGKTRVITRRVAHLVANGVPARRICAITFTNKAAGEMKSRVNALVGERGYGRGGVWVSTFHALCARLLREEAALANRTPNFTIYDTQDKTALVKEVLEDLHAGDTAGTPAAVGQAISRLKDRMLSPAEALEQAQYHQERTVAEVFAAYHAALRARDAFDFDDLLVETVRLLTGHEDALARVRDRFHYLLVDEYQDTNSPQYRLCRLIADGRRNICVTGDPDQAIYSWRGADIRNILSFEEDYPDARVVKLEQNYRSTQTILAVADAVIAHNEDRKPKTLWTENQAGEPVRSLEFENGLDEAAFISRDVARAVDDGAKPSGFAVFYRVGAMSRVLEAAFRDRAIPYALVGGVAFYQRKEVKDLLAYLRLAANPADDGSFLRVVNVPPRKVGKATIEALREAARGHDCPLFTVARDADVLGGLPRGAGRAVKGFVEALDAVRTLADGPVEAALSRLIDITRYEDYLEAQGDEAAERIENVAELVSSAAIFDREEPGAGLHSFLANSALQSDVDGWDSEGGTVTLMTLHSAKGLEFPSVYIAGLEERVLPHALSSESREEMEEERRLLYVGITRARERLTLTRCRYRMAWGTEERHLPSRFLREIPGELLMGMRSTPWDD